MTMTEHVRITGRVQGVFYRGWTRDRAPELGLRGWVRNRDDGSVEALVAGPEDAVGRLIGAMRDGPGAARVNDVSWSETAPFAGEGFVIRGQGGSFRNN